jgi:hypothetical protein
MPCKKPTPTPGCPGPEGAPEKKCAFCKNMRAAVPIPTSNPQLGRGPARQPGTQASSNVVAIGNGQQVVTTFRPPQPTGPRPPLGPPPQRGGVVTNLPASNSNQLPTSPPPRIPARNAPPVPQRNPQPLAQPVVVATAPSKKLADCLPDQGPGKLTGSPTDLIKGVKAALDAITDFAVGDATTFHGNSTAKAKEQELRNDPERMKSMKSAEQTAGGSIHYRQTDLKSAHDNTVKAKGAICTTFALCAAHILTKGKRQAGGVRVEIIGVNRNLGTHMYVVCGRAGNTLSDISSWGANAVIVDLWAAALGGHKNFQSKIDKTDWRLSEGPLGQFYDNARADPADGELARTVNVGSLDRSKKEVELAKLSKELQDLGTAPFLKQKREELTGKIALLKTELGLK